jgi:hypothetical protein
MIEILITILALLTFETICGIDNAVINANILKTIGKKQRKFFFTWGIFIAVFVVRGLLPFLIVWLAWASIFTTAIVYFSIKVDPILAFAATIGISLFFITDGFKQNAEKTEKKLIKKKVNLSDWSKVLYLEVLDASFSIDGVIGAFAFTTAVPLILIGNGLGAIIVRNLTIKGMDKIVSYTYLKNGAMYSIGFLGILMMFEAFGLEVPFFLAPAIIFTMLGIFFCMSRKRT